MALVIGRLALVAAMLAGCAAPLELTSRTIAGQPVRIGGQLTLPEGAGPHPAVVLLHGSGGAAATLRSPWLEIFRKAGIATLVIDSYSGRGMTSMRLGDLADRGTVPLERVWDAHAAAEYLRGRPDIDARRLVLMGQSQGGITTLYAQQMIGGMRFADFAAYIALYPDCGTSAMNVTYERPTLILIGGADDWTPTDRCELLVAYKRELRDPAPELRVYPGAYHGFDQPGGGGVTDVDYFMNRVVAHFGYDAAAARTAERDALDFIARHLRLQLRR